MKLTQKKLREIIKQELKLQEASATGNIDGGEGPPKTPYAFQSKRKKDKEKEDKIAKQSGYSIVETINEMTVGQMLAKQGKKIKMVKKYSCVYDLSEKNPEKAKKSSLRWRENNKEKVEAYLKKY